MREIVLIGVIGTVLDLIFFGLSLVWLLANGITMLANSRKQTLWDMMLKTVVVHDPNYVGNYIPG